MNELIFTFYPSYYAYAKELPAKERLAFYDAILRYFFDGEECDESNPAYKVFMLVKPNITASLRMKMSKKRRNTSANTCPNTSANTSAKCSPKGYSIGTKEQRKGNVLPPTPSSADFGGVAAARSRPTWEDVRLAAHNCGIPEDFAKQFFADMERDNWAYVNRHGNTATVNRLCLASVLSGRWRARKNGGTADGRGSARGSKPGGFAEQKTHKIGLEDD